MAKKRADRECRDDSDDEGSEEETLPEDELLAQSGETIGNYIEKTTGPPTPDCMDPRRS